MEAGEGPKIQLQKATINDISTLISIEKKVAGLKLYSAMTSDKEWRAEFEKPNTAVYLITKSDQVVGDVSFEKKDGNAYISGLAVEPAFQGMGIGQEAIRQILEELKDCKTIELVTHPENKPAVNLYLSLGFEIKETKENYFGDGEPRVVMVKKNK